jgi:histidine triad (HIT) family protein
VPCIFCQIAAGSAPAHVVLDEPDRMAFLDTRPVFHGHVLLIPRKHVVTLAELPPIAVGPYFQAAQRLSVAVERALGADGTFVGINNKVSQSVPHLHVHIVPRKFKDGLRGFFWPRTPYASEADAAAMAASIRTELEASL